MKLGDVRLKWMGWGQGKWEKFIALKFKVKSISAVHTKYTAAIIEDPLLVGDNFYKL